MIERDNFIAYLILLGFKPSPSSHLMDRCDEFDYRMRYKSLIPVMLSVKVYQKKTHIGLRTGVYNTRLCEKRGVPPRGHHGEAMRWLKDNFHDIVKEAESSGATRI